MRRGYNALLQTLEQIIVVVGIQRLHFEKLILFLFVLSWVNLPAVVYEKWSLTFLTNGHGHNLIPYLLPVLWLFLLYYFFRSVPNLGDKNPLYSFATAILNRSTLEDLIFLVLIIYMVLINLISAMIDSSEANLRMVMPLITAHFFYWLYKRYSEISKISDLDNYFALCVFFSISAMLILQLMMFAGLVPGLVDGFNEESQIKIISFIRIDGGHLGKTSYTALILLFLLLFYKFKLPKYVIAIGYILILLVLVINQVRGALLPAAIILLASLFYQLTMNRLIVFLVLVFTVLGFYLYSVDHRLFSYDSSANERVQLITETFRVFLESPIFGRGSFFVENLRFGFYDQFVVHNYYLRFLTAYGLIGVMIFLCYLQPLFLRQFTYRNLIGLFVVFSIFTFEPYLMWPILIIAVFHQKGKQEIKMR